MREREKTEVFHAGARQIRDVEERCGTCTRRCWNAGMIPSIRSSDISSLAIQHILPATRMPGH